MSSKSVFLSSGVLSPHIPPVLPYLSKSSFAVVVPNIFSNLFCFGDLKLFFPLIFLSFIGFYASRPKVFPPPPSPKKPFRVLLPSSLTQCPSLEQPLPTPPAPSPFYRIDYPPPPTAPIRLATLLSRLRKHSQDDVFPPYLPCPEVF